MGFVNRARAVKRWKWLGIPLFAALVWWNWSHVTLAGFIALVAGEEYPRGIDAAEADVHAMHMDSLTVLARRSPSQLAMYLRAPWPEWRAVVCQSLAHDASERTGEWDGAGMELARVALHDPNKEVRKFGQYALREVASYVPQDAEGIFQQAVDAEAGRDRNQVLRILADQPVVAQKMHSLLQGLRSSEDRGDRAIAFELLTRNHPLEITIGFVREFVGDGQAANRAAGRSVRSLVLSRPDLLRELLNGNVNEKTLALDAIRATLRSAQAGNVNLSIIPAKIADRQSPVELFRLAEEVASQSLYGSDPLLLKSALAYLEISPRGGHLLTAALPKANHDDRVHLLKVIDTITWRSYRVGGFRYSPAETKLLGNLLTAPDPQTRSLAASIHRAGVPEPRNIHNPFPPGRGTRDPKLGATVSELLPDGVKDTDLLAIEYFNCVAPLPESQIESYIAALRRQDKFAKRNHIIKELRKRFPDHPGVQELVDDYLARNQPGGAARPSSLFEELILPKR